MLPFAWMPKTGGMAVSVEEESNDEYVCEGRRVRLAKRTVSSELNTDCYVDRCSTGLWERNVQKDGRVEGDGCICGYLSIIIVVSRA